LARRLVAGGAEEVVAFDRYPDPARLGEVAASVRVVQGDVLEPQELMAAMTRHRVDRVAHLAFPVGAPVAEKLLPYVRLAAMGTANVLEAARLCDVMRVLFCSSIAVYGGAVFGEQGPAMVTEDLPLWGSNPYSGTKVWGEGLVLHYNESFGMDNMIVRFASTFGLGRSARSSYGGIMADSAVHYLARVELAVRGVPIVMPNDEHPIDMTYAADTAEAAWLALTVERPPHRIYNVCSGERRSQAEYLACVRKLLPDADISVGNEPEWAHLLMDNTRLRNELGFVPQYTMESGLEDYVDRARRYLEASADKSSLGN
jgi:nucleoside-diphosphate-sugar epimerase